MSPVDRRSESRDVRGSAALLRTMQWALGRQWVLAPTSRRTKRPAVAWLERAPFTFDELHGYVSRGCGLAVRTGSRDGYQGEPCGGGSGLVVIDVDAYAGGVRSAAWPPTWTVETPGGGLHIYYEWSGADDIPSRAGALGPHVDVRARGGIAVLPGSPHPSGGIYRWAEGFGPADLPLARLPDCVAEQLRERSPRLSVCPQPPVVAKWIAQGRFATYAEVALRRAVARIAGAAEGVRNHVLNREAFCIARIVAAGALPLDHARAALEAAGTSTGLDEREVNRTLTSAMAAGMRRPVDLLLLEAQRRLLIARSRRHR